MDVKRILRPLSRTPLAPPGRWLLSRMRVSRYVPPVGWVRFGNLRRLTPISEDFGYDRGQPIDRYYIERFLNEHAADVRGRVLEIGDSTYTRRFGGERVTQSDVLHVRDHAPEATIIADLSRGTGVPSEAFDCIILTQTLHLIFDLRSAIRTVHRSLNPGGTVLATVPGISTVSRYDVERWGQFWNFTTQSARRIFEDAFPAADVAVEAHGNVLAATSFLYGLSSQELRPAELDYRDPNVELLITIRATRPLG